MSLLLLVVVLWRRDKEVDVTPHCGVFIIRVNDNLYHLLFQVQTIDWPSLYHNHLMYSGVVTASSNRRRIVGETYESIFTKNGRCYSLEL